MGQDAEEVRYPLGRPARDSVHRAVAALLVCVSIPQERITGHSKFASCILNEALLNCLIRHLPWPSSGTADPPRRNREILEVRRPIGRGARDDSFQRRMTLINRAVSPCLS